MSHYAGNESFKDYDEDFLKQFKKPKNELDEQGIELGATGTYPDGKIASNDEGALAIGIAIVNERIIIDFGKPVHTIGFTKVEAVALANYLFDKARTL